MQFDSKTYSTQPWLGASMEQILKMPCRRTSTPNTKGYCIPVINVITPPPAPKFWSSISEPNMRGLDMNATNANIPRQKWVIWSDTRCLCTSVLKLNLRVTNAIMWREIKLTWRNIKLRSIKESEYCYYSALEDNLTYALLTYGVPYVHMKDSLFKVQNYCLLYSSQKVCNCFHITLIKVYIIWCFKQGKAPF